MDMRNAIVTITGGTGSFGSTMVKHLLDKEVAQIRIFSRDETKQDEMRRRLNDSRVSFHLGDVRDRESVNQVMRGTNFVFHAAALKQVPSCEFFPDQATQTNVLGSRNVIESAAQHSVESVVCLSTDKAVYPINVMGMTKALMEKFAQGFVRNDSGSSTRVSVTRYGNVMCSRGSVIPVFARQITSGKPITITNPNMTRFLMSLSDSVDLVDYAFLQANPGDILVKKSPACTVATLANAVAEALGYDAPDIQIIGTRHAEKLHETLLSSEEVRVAVDEGDYFRSPLDTRSLDYDLYFSTGDADSVNRAAYDSFVTNQLSVEEAKTLLLANREFSALMNGL